MTFQVRRRDEVELQFRGSSSQSFDDEDPEKPRRLWYHRLPLLIIVACILGPQPSILRMLIYHHWRSLHQPAWAVIHFVVSFALTVITLTSLTITVTRDPGPVHTPTAREGVNSDNIGLAEALMGGGDEDDFMKPGRWCRKCWAPKPERAHHCSMCGRCVMKMDHHCPWLGHSCIGHRTYPSFVHFLTSATLLALYVATVAARALMYSFRNPFSVDETTPIHEMALSLYGIIISLVVGPFAAYHFYLITTGQTTLEHITPFMLLRHLPPLPRTGHSLSDPPLEPELSYQQRRLVKDAHSRLSLYDLGWRRNWALVFGWETRWGWVPKLLWGGSSPGDGMHHPRNPRAEDILAKLAADLVKADHDRFN
ncbi:zf-DHHC-domain-containing protein [Coprinellus micaceus]|uniref:Palmitoyltransferase n=1 Tax=Coprinellus micaceus TaxID=71717 RepID=A0A4Y7SS61_COPMI|nr:zf-DHHC-domain-containing protein [Coprinellus micaceus]